MGQTNFSPEEGQTEKNALQVNEEIPPLSSNEQNSAKRWNPLHSLCALPPPVRFNFLVDTTRTIGNNVFITVVWGFILVLTRRMGGSDLDMALLAAAPYIGNFVTFFLVNFLPYKYPQRFSGITMGLARGMFFSIAFITSPTQIVVLGIVCNIVASSGNALLLNVIKIMYPASQRGRLMSGSRFIGTLVTLILSPVAGYLIDQIGYAPVMEVATFIGAFASLAYVLVRPLEGQENEPPPPRRSIMSTLHLYLENRRYTFYVIGYLTWGLGYFMALPLISILMADKNELQLSYSFIGGIAFVQTGSALLSYLWWGTFLDRYGAFRTLQLAFGGIGLALLCYAVVPNTIPLLIIVPTILIGITAGALEMGGSNILIELAPGGETSRYFVAMNLFSGGMGALAPVLGTTLAAGLFGLRPTFAFGAIVAGVGLVILSLVARMKQEERVLIEH